MHEFDSNGTKVIVGGRQTGKTTAVVEWAKGHANRAVVVSTVERVRNLRQMGLAADQTVAYADTSKALRGRNLEVAVDDLLDYVYADLGVFPAFVTIDGEPVATEPEPPADPETPAELQAEAVRFVRDENVRLRQQVATLVELLQDDLGITCDGRCVSASDVGLPMGGIAYPDPECSLHGDEATVFGALAGKRSSVALDES